jgi:hypothetical protein
MPVRHGHAPDHRAAIVRAASGRFMDHDGDASFHSESQLLSYRCATVTGHGGAEEALDLDAPRP